MPEISRFFGIVCSLTIITLRISTPSMATTSLCSTSAPWVSSLVNYRLAPSDS